MKTKKSKVLTVENLFLTYFFCFLLMGAESAIENGEILTLIGVCSLISIVGTFFTLVVFALGKKYFPKRTKKIIHEINADE